ncbi:nose resistant to fluoxetine protein 6-like [Diorhabda carinulata]|uniref:nose resistant to fluoxetine protein 6-like n=1 Tax=Diorhabda carinulata TaxID=1163345 RepID=UPI0025A07593|nr:nose resistant to fluoxetine protein 6-like [Diorhabda carinulata]XP_057655920.1 nose resistant to fluoxetine protein 6-like [Diorhabda carinulata]
MKCVDMNTFIYIDIFVVIFPIVNSQFLNYDLLKHHMNVLNINALSESCDGTVNSLFNKLNQSNIPDEDTWALQMLDAIPKSPVGLLSYNMAQLGDFDECIRIHSKKYNIIGKYCLGKISIDNPNIYNNSEFEQNQLFLNTLIGKASAGLQAKKSIWATCLPSNCTENDVIKIMSLTETSGINISNVVCQTIHEVYPELDRDAIIGISVFSLLFGLTIISTLTDVYFVYIRKEKLKPIYESFSIYTNGKSLFSIPNRSENLSCLDGMRVLSILWILWYHVTYASMSIPLTNNIDIVNFIDSTYSMLFLHGDIATDTFLLIGGTLVTHSFFRREKFQKMRKFDLFKHYLHRYIRLTPLLTLVVLFDTTLIRYLSSGPIWDTINEILVKPCKTHWWETLLHIQNKMNHGSMCVSHSWYVDVDMQLYILSPFIFWLLKFNKKLGISALILATFASITLGFYRGYIREMCAQPDDDKERSYYSYFTGYYVQTETRAATWLLGTILGYFLAHNKYTDVKIPKKYTIFLWVTTIIIVTMCVFGGYDLYRCKNSNRVVNALYIALNRPVFTMAIIWIIWACATNHAGAINLFLSHPVFQFLNKCTYSFYLIHMSYLYIAFASIKTAMYFGLYYITFWYCQILLATFGLSIICILLIEIPFAKLEKIMIQNH